MKLMLKIAGGVILAIVLLTAGCAALISSSASSVDKAVNAKQEWRVHVAAPAGMHWSGAIGSSTVEGNGSRYVRIKDSSITSANAQKMDAGRWLLTLKLINKDGKVVDSAGTSAEYGLASVSGSDF